MEWEAEACCRNPERAERVEGSPTREFSGMMARLEKFGFAGILFLRSAIISLKAGRRNHFFERQTLSPHARKNSRAVNIRT
jgi:hypothetical protein